MIQDLQETVNRLYNTPSDINEHIPTMIKYGSECEHITEMGVRWVVSTWAWLACAPKKLISYDLYNPSHWGSSIVPVIETAKQYGLDFTFIEQDVLKIEIEETDLLFIDTWHAYDQLKKELEIHSSKVRKYICFHDTTTFEFNDESLQHENSWNKETSGKGLWLAIEEFLEENKDTWVLKERFTNNNGFTIIERIKELNFHVYAINWNEERLLPHFFKHYEQAEKIFIIDNNSTDNSINIIKEHNRDIISFDTDKKFDDETIQKLKNTVWKQSRDVDFVIVQDLDEFLFFPEYPNNIKAGLSYLKTKGVTIIKPDGYNMFCSDEEFDNVSADSYLSSHLFYGSKIPFPGFYDKCICFDPSKIKEINYSPGANLINPVGKINIIEYGLLLHYKYIGKKYLSKRYTEYGKRLSQNNLNKGYSFQYLQDATSTLDKYYADPSIKSLFNIIHIK